MYKKIGCFLLFFSLFLAGKASAQELTAASPNELREALANPKISAIKLESGLYKGNFSIERKIHITGEKGTRIIGTEKGNVLTIAADDVIVENLEIEGSGSQDAGIYVKGDRAYLHHIALKNLFHGIHARNSYGHRFENNLITSFNGMNQHKGYGIYLAEAPNTAVRDNYFYNTQDGVYVSYSDFCEVKGNIMSRARYGVHTMDSRNVLIADNQVTESINGLMIMQSYEVIILENFFHKNTKTGGAGIFMYDTFDSKIASNIVKGNFKGIILENAQRNRLEFNAFLQNDTGLEIGENSNENTIYFNNFSGNTRQVITEKDNRNVFSKDHYGNYFDDHDSLNLDNDHKVDFPYKSGDVFYQMADAEPLLQVFYQSPAVELWNMIEQYTPIPSDTFIIDESPLIKPAPLEQKEIKSEKNFTNKNYEIPLMLFFFLILIASLLILKYGRKNNEV
ncbi:nitrous oxidase accessory protein NosD [Sporosarcina globispora]|uniref:Nitrous oxidase accessory protein NosD n=1 Tax=Sporosarcina globispora TaxID=1459 RepID=A0A0M0GG00_SPOGL|nr:NosD domain-containing protein [Sporosarcina globispora]KON88361.1 nitrous oxidase accessory protein NosD [Sporosarcina globispora]